MKHLFTISIVCLSYFARSQQGQFWVAQNTMDQMFYSNGSPQYDHFFVPYNENKVDVLKTEQVKSLKCSVSNKKGKANYSYEINFNEKGKIVSYQTKKFTKTYSYLNDTLLLTIETKSKKGIELHERKYNENNKLTFIQTTKNGKVKHKENYTYNDQGRISKSEITNLNKNKRYEMIYEYYDGKKLKFQQFSVNGKIKKTWSFDCKEEGELNNSKVAVLESVCRYEEQNRDGSYVEYVRKIVKGKDVLIKNYFSKDSIRYMNETYKEDSILLNRSIFSKNEIQHINFNKRQKITYSSKQKFNDQHQLLESQSSQKGKIRFTMLIDYNSNGTISTYKVANTKGVYSTTNYVYSHF